MDRDRRGGDRAGARLMRKGSRAPSEDAGEDSGGQVLRRAGENRQKPPGIPGAKPASRPWLRIFGIGSIMGVILLAGALMGLDHWIRTAPLPELSPEVSTTVLDRNGKLLRAYQVADGRWRLPVTEAEVDRGYIAQLLAYEDRRFYRHPGVDPLALLRAAWQALIHGRPVSGASTITMQVARLLSERPTDRIGAKLAQIRLALALERQLQKAEILQLYLTLAPFGGNIEGVRAAALSWFGKEPRRLTPAESALLVALPQSPQARRPDRHGEAARAARDRVLSRAARHRVLALDEAEAAMAEPVPIARRDFPALAPHLADRIIAAPKQAATHHVTIDAGLQGSLETLLAERAARLPRGVSAALMVADHRT